MDFRRLSRVSLVLTLMAVMWSACDNEDLTEERALRVFGTSNSSENTWSNDSTEASNGWVEVSWQIEGSTCKHSGVVDVKIELNDGGIKALAIVTCTDGTHVLIDVDPGTYSATLVGLNSSGSAIYSGYLETIHVDAGAQTMLPLIKLTAN